MVVKAEKTIEAVALFEIVLFNKQSGVTFEKIMNDFDKQFDDFYSVWKVREDAYIASQILRNRKWHNFWYFLRFIFTGKD